MINTDEIKMLARLARLEFSGGEISAFTERFGEMIDFCNGINAMAQETEENALGDTVGYDGLRNDEVAESLPAEKILSPAVSENGCFVVRRVVK